MIARAIYFTAILFAVLLPLSRAGINIFGATLLLLWIIEGDFKRKFYAVKKQPFLQALAIFLLYQFVALLWTKSDNIQEALSYDFKYIYFLIIPILYTSFDASRYRDLLYAFFVGMTLSALQSLSIYFHIYDFHEVNIESLSPHMWHTIYSIFLAFCAIAALILSLEKSSIMKKTPFIILFILTSSALFLGISRTGEGIYLFGLVAVLIALFRVRLSKLLIAIMIVSITISLLYHFNPRFQKRIMIAQEDITKLLHKDDYCTSLGGRVFTWKIAHEVFQEEPLLGMGTIDHIQYLKGRMNEDKHFSECEIKDMIGYYHAQYIEIVSQTGILGLLLLLYLFYALINTTNHDESIINIKYLFIMVFLLAFFLDVPFRKMFTLALFTLISSIILLEEKEHHAV